MKQINIILFFAFFSLGNLSGFLVGDYGARILIKRQAIEHGLAHYHPKTGEWQWGPVVGYLEAEELLPKK
jgi:hypothetical protein